MRKIPLIILFVFILITQSIAQNKSERRIYLWDVTLSMKGFKGNTSNIYNDVVSFLEKEINSITDESTEIIVLPFTVEILDRKEVKATIQGKSELIKWIKSFNNEEETYTNICVPFIEVKEKYIQKDKRNILFLLTDGAHNDKNSKYTKADLLRLLEEWCDFSRNNDAYALYVMLTKEAVDEEIIEVCKKCERLGVTEGHGFNVLDLQPSELIKFNIKDDEGKPAQITVTCKKDVPLPENIIVKVTAEENQFIEIEQSVEIKNGKIAFDVKYKQPYSTLKTLFEENEKLPIHLELINSDEIKQSTGNLVLLTQNDIELELINKPEKTLRIHVKK